MRFVLRLFSLSLLTSIPFAFSANAGCNIPAFADLDRVNFKLKSVSGTYHVRVIFPKLRQLECTHERDNSADLYFFTPTGLNARLPLSSVEVVTSLTPNAIIGAQKYEFEYFRISESRVKGSNRIRYVVTFGSYANESLSDKLGIREFTYEIGGQAPMASGKMELENKTFVDATYTLRSN